MASETAEFYKNKNIFITGGTGFLGIALIEKLLRTTPEVGKIYLLMREKRGKTVEQRLEDLTKNEVFEVLLKEQSKDIFKKLIPVQGDVGLENLGISPADRQTLVNNVNVIIHSAATLDFHEPLKPTVNINLLGTRRVTQLAKETKNLASLVHVSSAYVNSYLVECEENLYPAPADAEKIIEMINTLNDEELAAKQASILGEHPNTYTFTKHLAEHEVAKCADKFPCGIVRPSMITGAWKEPVPGWTISKNGPQGFLMGASKGVIRRLPIGAGLIYDYIPVDVVVNQVLVTGQHVYNKKSNEISIFHCTSSTTQPFKWEGVQDKINGYLHKYPLKSAVWYPNLKFMSSLLLFKLSAILFHFAPAYVLDAVTKVAGGRPILVRLHKNVWSSLKLLEKFIFTEWKFHNNNTKELIKTQSLTDKKMYNIDLATLEWEVYFINLVNGVRRYLSKEDPKTLEAARSKDKILLAAHVILQLSLYGLLWWFTALIVGCTTAQCALVVPLYYILFSFL